MMHPSRSKLNGRLVCAECSGHQAANPRKATLLSSVSLIVSINIFSDQTGPRLTCLPI
jgi:hypothetical protein